MMTTVVGICIKAEHYWEWWQGVIKASTSSSNESREMQEMQQDKCHICPLLSHL